MTIPNEIKKRLLANWGDKASALMCYAEVRFYDPCSPWECYVLAMDKDEDTIACIISGFSIEVCGWTMKELAQSFNGEGDAPIFDSEFRRIRADILLRKLEGRYDRERHY